MNTSSDPLWDEIDNRETPPYALCEGILCLHGRDQHPAWWRMLIEVDQVAWEPQGRIREASLDRCRDEVEKLVVEGFRPVLFVPRPADWPRVYDNLGRFRGYAELYVRGRHDATMQQLLQGPSPEVAQICVGGGRVFAPNLDYAKAVECLYPLTVKDLLRFIPEKDEQVHPPAHLCFVSRLNPYRFIYLDRRDAGSYAWQCYRTVEQNKTQTKVCNEPLRMDHGMEVRFVDGRSDLTEVQAEQLLKIEGWVAGEPSNDAGLKGIISQLAQIVKSQTNVVLTYAQQRWLSGWLQGEAAVKGGAAQVRHKFFQWVESAAVALVPIRTRGVLAPRTLGVKTPVVSNKIVITLLITETQATDAGVSLSLCWAEGKKPAELTAIQVLLQERSLASNKVIWSPDGTRLELLGVRVDTPAVKWTWHEGPPPKLNIEFQTAQAPGS